MADRAHDYADARQLAEARAQLKLSETRAADMRRQILNDGTLSERCRKSAWYEAGNYAVTKPGIGFAAMTCPPGWPPPYRDFEHYLSLNVEGWAQQAVASTELSSVDKHLKAFKEAVGR